MKRKVLVILSNRLSPSQSVRYLELTCGEDGTILKQHPLRRLPREAAFDEVWENDEGKPSLDFCTRMKKKYSHPLIKKRAK